MSKPLVSIMIPVYNQEKYIADAIESALKQDYENIEIVIGDDSSDDNTEQIIKTYIENPKIKYYRNTVRLGRVKNYHSLLYEKAQGDWVVNLDGDDTFTDASFISSSIKLIESFDDTNIVFLQAGHYITYDNKAEEVLKLPQIEKEYQLMEGKDYLLNLLKIDHFSHLATIYKREAALKTDFYTTDILSTDMESILKLAITGKVLLVKKPIGKWLQHGANASSSSGLEKLIDNLKWIDNVSAFSILQTNDKKLWEKWKCKQYKVQLTGVFIHEASLRNNNKEIFKLLNYFWVNYRFLFLYPVFLKKTMDILIKTKK